MHPPPFRPSPPLVTVALQGLGPPPARAVVVGSRLLVASLHRAGHTVTRWRLADPSRLPEPAATQAEDVSEISAPVSSPPTAWAEADVLVAVGLVSGCPEPLALLRTLVVAARPGARVLLAEPSAYGWFGLLVGRLLGRLLHRPLLVDPSALAGCALGSGLTDLELSWPQGVRELVLVSGRVHPLARQLLLARP
jgi:hypothetical protein